MEAHEAKKLKVGDLVVTAFSNSHCVARISSINWPHFKCVTALSKGKRKSRDCRYRSIHDVDEWTQKNGPPKDNAGFLQKTKGAPESDVVLSVKPSALTVHSLPNGWWICGPGESIQGPYESKKEAKEAKQGLIEFYQLASGERTDES